MKKDVLTRPFPPEQIKQRAGQGGKQLNYLETHSVIARLNEGCDAWDFSVEKYEIFDEEVIVLGKLVIESSVTKSAFGGSSITRDRDGKAASIADDLKAAASDALKKCASLVGIGLELWAGGGAQTPRAESRPMPAPSSPNDRLTGRQYNAITSVIRRQSIGRDEFARMLDERFRKSELGHLSRREASAFLSELSAGANGAHP